MTVQWISHRGESFDAPENTMSAFRLAFGCGTDGLECDIHRTADGILVCSHDDHTGRMGDRICRISDSTFDELSSINVSGGKKGYPFERIPKFSELLALHRGGMIYYVEVKGEEPELLEPLKQDLEQAGIPKDRIVVISFSKEIILKSKDILPEVKTLWLASGAMPADPEQLIAILTGLRADGIDACADENRINRAYVNAVKAAGFHFAVWTIDAPGQAKRFMEYGVDSITSNCAGHLRDLLG